MNNTNDFTVNKTAFKDLITLVDTLHSNRQKIVVILDPGLQVNKSDYYTDALKAGALIKTGMKEHENINGGALTQRSFKGEEGVFLDFFHPSTPNVSAITLT